MESHVVECSEEILDWAVRCQPELQPRKTVTGVRRLIRQLRERTRERAVPIADAGLRYDAKRDPLDPFERHRKCRDSCDHFRTYQAHQPAFRQDELEGAVGGI